MKYELLSKKRVNSYETVYEVKCIPNKLSKFFGNTDRIVPLIYKGEKYNVNGRMVFYTLKGQKLALSEIAIWLHEKLHYDKYSKETNKKEKITFTTTLIPLNVKNLNNHIYLDNENLRECINNLNNRITKIGVVYGELNYPDKENFFNYSLGRISHTIKNVRIEDDNVIGEITIANTHHGRELEHNFINEVVFRPRISGIVDENGLVIIKYLFTFDAVRKDVDAFFVNEKSEYEIDESANNG